MNKCKFSNELYKLDETRHKEMINLHKSLIGLIKNPSKKVQLQAVDSYGTSWFNIFLIKKPFKEVIDLAIEKSMGRYCLYIETPPEELIQQCLRASRGELYRRLKNPSKEITIEALKLNPWNLQYVKKMKPEYWDLIFNNIKFNQGTYHSRLQFLMDILEDNSKKVTYQLLERIINEIIPNKVRQDYRQAFCEKIKMHPKYKNNASVILDTFKNLEKKEKYVS